MMRTSPVPVTSKATEEFPRSRVPEVLRTLVLLTKQGSGSGKSSSPLDGELEEVLVDTEVDGCRYLLVRMPPPAQAQTKLSPREFEIVRMVAKGHPNKVIADVLCISSWTVCTHLRRIFAKLGVGSRAAMVARLSELGTLNGDHAIPGKYFR